MPTAVPLLSTVIPVYRSGNVLPELLAHLHGVRGFLTPAYEIVLVNDGSPVPADWPAIQQFAALDARVRGRHLSRNFGQYHALTAGLEARRSEWGVVMACDLQDQPEAIPHLLLKAWEGYEALLAHIFRLDLNILLTYSDKPLRLAVYFGLLLSGRAFLLGLIMLCQITAPEYASLIVSITLFSGIVISVLGIVGLYVEKNFEGMPKCPPYVLA